MVVGIEDVSVQFFGAVDVNISGSQGVGPSSHGTVHVDPRNYLDESTSQRVPEKANRGLELETINLSCLLLPRSKKGQTIVELGETCSLRGFWTASCFIYISGVVQPEI